MSTYMVGIKSLNGDFSFLWSNYATFHFKVRFLVHGYYWIYCNKEYIQSNKYMLNVINIQSISNGYTLQQAYMYLSESLGTKIRQNDQSGSQDSHPYYFLSLWIKHPSPCVIIKGQIKKPHCINRFHKVNWRANWCARTCHVSNHLHLIKRKHSLKTFWFSLFMLRNRAGNGMDNVEYDNVHSNQSRIPN